SSLHAQWVSSLPAALPKGTFRQPAARAIPERALRGRHPRFGGLHAAEQGTVHQTNARFTRLSSRLFAGTAGPLGGTKPVSGERPTVRRGGLALPERV